LASLGHPSKFQRASRLGSVTARHLVVGVTKLCGVEQRAPPMFGRATITLGHISSCCFKVGRSICLSVTNVSPAKAAEPMVILFGMLTWVPILILRPKLPLPMWISTPIKYMVPWARPSVQPKQIIDQFSHFGRAHYCDRHSTTLLSL